MTVALPIAGTAYKRWPRFGDVIGAEGVERKYIYLAPSPIPGNHKVLVIAGESSVPVGSTTAVTDANLTGASILLEGPETFGRLPSRADDGSMHVDPAGAVFLRNNGSWVEV